MEQKYNWESIAIGIDPGRLTGFAVWDMNRGEFFEVSAYSFWRTIDELENFYYGLKFDNDDDKRKMVVVIENPNMNKPTFRQRGANFREHISQSVGMNKRDAQLLIQWCELHNIDGLDVRQIQPGKYSGSKLPALEFKKLTGWEYKTNQHGRDAAMLVYKFKA